MWDMADHLEMHGGSLQDAASAASRVCLRTNLGLLDYLRPTKNLYLKGCYCLRGPLPEVANGL
jgi:hypothetical protein